MIHHKTYYSKKIQYKGRDLFIEGPIPPDFLSSLKFHSKLTSFRIADEQKEALIEIAGLDEGRINIVRDDDLIVGYVTFVYPDPLERWSEGKMDNLIELGAIEVAPEYRGAQLGKNLLRLSMMDDAMEDYIIFTTEYYWHWDLKGSGLDVWKYRDMMEKMMNAGGLEWYATDDPEICSHPANCLMVRVGKRIDQDSLQRFDQIRFHNRFMF
ncbi:GNAT family N-acetyltransferase [Bacillus suaedae]|uniref:GNAT family N-acetyltransferase n=1 Tax=Halalkalibacter suaedae TaxID=2822140 RepID=A0A940WSD0_9BACI|nr:GNAT family N-acetyltransferase [Bacillus suaedae]MBP3949787.1 GNAT family N-acetyltransferase [Bacillus suaedae]